MFKSNMKKTAYQTALLDAKPGIIGPICYVKTVKSLIGSMKIGHSLLAVNDRGIQ